MLDILRLILSLACRSGGMSCKGFVNVIRSKLGCCVVMLCSFITLALGGGCERNAFGSVCLSVRLSVRVKEGVYPYKMIRIWTQGLIKGSFTSARWD